MKTITKNIALFIITLGILSSPFSIHAAGWVGPTANPPGNNVSAPVNVGGIYQIKAGDLGVINLFANYILSLGTIKSLGTISANRYCFNNGTANGVDQNCITSWPAGGTGGGIQSVVAGTNVTVDNTDPANPVVSSTATGGTSGVVVRKDGVPVLAPATTLNFLGSNITTTPSGNSVSISVAPATPTAIRKDGIQVSAAPLALDFTGNNITAQNVGGVVKINVAPTNPTAIQKDGIQVSAAPLAVNFVGDNITATNNGGIVSVGVNKLTVQKDGINVGAGNNFKGINFNFNGSSGWDIQNSPDGIAQVNYYGDGGTGGLLPSASPADKILRSDGTNWVQSPLVKHTVSSFQVNRPFADNATDTIFQAAKEINPGTPALGLFINKDGNTLVNGAKFTHAGISGTPATPLFSFSADDSFQTFVGTGGSKRGIAVRADGKVRVGGSIYSSQTFSPLFPGYFLGSNDLFQASAEFNNGALKGFGLGIDGTTRVEGTLAVNGSQAFFGNHYQSGDSQRIGDTIQSGDYTMQGPGATMTLGNSTNSAQLNITGNTGQVGDYILNGTISQIGNHSIQGNISQTGNINTQGRWAVIDSTASSIPPLQGAPETYSFVSHAGPGGANGTMGLTRDGRTKIVGSLQVNGPITTTGNLSVGGWIQTASLMNTAGNVAVCAETNGRLKLCIQPTPVVDITSTGVPSNSFSNHYTFPNSWSVNPNKATTVSYTIGNFTAGMNCTRTTEQGDSTDWDGTVTPTSASASIPVVITTYGQTIFKISCTNTTGQSSSDTASVYGSGSWTWNNLNYASGVAIGLPVNTTISVEAWGGGGGGGGFSSDINGYPVCGGGGGAGQYVNAQNVYTVTSPIMQAFISMGQGGLAGASGSGYPTTTKGEDGGDTIVQIASISTIANGGDGGGKGASIYMPGVGYGAQSAPAGNFYGTGGSSGQVGSSGTLTCVSGVGKTPSNSTGTGHSVGGNGSGFINLPQLTTGKMGAVRISWQ